MRLIDADAAIDALDALCDRECEYSKQQRNFMCGACRLGSAFDVIDELPSVQPTLYGYRIEHLAYIARVMEKEGLTAEEAVRTFGDMSRAVGMIIEEVQQKVEEMLYEQAGVQAGVPAAQTGDGGGDQQEGSAEGGGDLQAEAIRSSKRPAETK
jgi:hypothetical protein